MRIGTPLVVGFALVLVAVAGMSVLQAGDDKDKDKDKDKDSKEERTIADITIVDGTQMFPVEGVGLVVGLNDTGSDPLQSPERAALLQDMQKREIPGAEKILQSKRTALVRVRAMIPPGVRGCQSAGCWCRTEPKLKSGAAAHPQRRLHRGDTFDVEVQVPSKETTTSLEGGWLLEAWLHETAAVKGGAKLSGRVWARAEGPVLVSTALADDEKSSPDPRRGRVLGGGIATLDRGFSLLTDNEHRSARWTKPIATRISERFHGSSPDAKPVAETKNPLEVTLKIPNQYRHNIRRYLDVVGRMPIFRSDATEADRVLHLESELMNPATARVAALKLEGIGMRAIGALKNGLANSDPDVRFFSAEALAYLDEPIAAEELEASARDIPEFRAHALTAFSALDEAISRMKLRALMNDTESVELKYGAFRALRALDERDEAIPEELLGDHLHLHTVATTGKPVIHVSSRDRTEIVLFGRGLELGTPLQLNAGRNILLTASTGAAQLQMSRFAVGRDTDHERSGLGIDEVIHHALELGATYPDVVAMLVQADKNHNLPGRLEMDALPDPARLAQRLRRHAETAAASDNVAMPNLFHWFDVKKGKPGDSGDGDEVGEASHESDKPKKYLTKPSAFDRLLGRSAN